MRPTRKPTPAPGGGWKGGAGEVTTASHYLVDGPRPRAPAWPTRVPARHCSRRAEGVLGAGRWGWMTGGGGASGGASGSFSATCAPTGRRATRALSGERGARGPTAPASRLGSMLGGRRRPISRRQPLLATLDRGRAAQASIFGSRRAGVRLPLPLPPPPSADAPNYPKHQRQRGTSPTT